MVHQGSQEYRASQAIRVYQAIVVQVYRATQVSQAYRAIQVTQGLLLLLVEAIHKFSLIIVAH